MELVFCSQLFGVGKTSFARRVAEGLKVAFRDRLSYVRLVSILANAASVEIAIARMVISAAEVGFVISRAEADGVRAGSCELISVLSFVQDRLVANECVPGAITQLFLHFDEFDLSRPALLRAYKTLRDADSIDRYDDVWSDMLVPILQQPNLHVIVTGKPPELAILGTRVKGQSPTRVYHAVLGTLGESHIIDILHRLKVQPAVGSTFQCAFSVLGLPDLQTGASAAECDEMEDPSWSSFVRGLLHFTAGVPRFVCIAVGQLLRMRISGGLQILRELAPCAISSLFDVAARLTVSILSSTDGTFVTGPGAALKTLLFDSTTTDTTASELLELMLNVFGQYSAPLDSDPGRSMIQCAARFGAYTDHVPSGGASTATGPEMIRLVMPGILQEYWRSPEVLAFMAAKLPDMMSSRTRVVLPSAGTIGDALECRFQKSLDLHWTLSESKLKTSSALLGLLQSSARLHDVDVVFGLRVDHSEMGKVGNAGETPKCANMYIPLLLDQCRVSDARHIFWIPLAQSHSADRMCSLVVRSSNFELASAGPSTGTQRALLGFALKNYADSSMSESVLHREICNFADTVYSLTPDQRALYGCRLTLYIFAPESSRVLLRGLMSSGRMLFPLAAGSKTFMGVPNARGVTFSDLAFDVIVVPLAAATAFLI